MTEPKAGGIARTGTSSAVVFPFVADDETHIVAVDVPGDDYWVVRTAEGLREALVSRFELDQALVTGNKVVPAWSSPEALMRTCGLGPLAERALAILHEIFGSTASISAELADSPESRHPSLVLRLEVPGELRHLRHTFLDRYVREAVIPPNAPVPALLWAYRDAVPA